VGRKLGAIEFRILGPVEIYNAGKATHLNAPRQKMVLTRLLLDANRVVPVASLIEAVWGENPPPTARGQIHVSISVLRQRLGSPDIIVTGSDGYSLHIEESQLDLAMFGRYLVDARAAIAAGDPHKAEIKFVAALELWRGRALAGIGGRFAETAAARLEERRLMAVEERMKVTLDLGRHRELIDELVGLTDEYPLREQLCGLLMVALYRSGRQAEALTAYRDVRHMLIEELGLEPGEQLRGLERAILNQDPSLDGEHSDAALSAVQPHQLPADIADFASKAGPVEQLRQYLAEPTAPGSPVQPLRIAVITGLCGMGKSTLAVHVAHKLLRLYPDGQLFTDLRGSNHRPADPGEILGRFLRALGSTGTMPSATDERADAYRTRLAHSRVLVVLDDVEDESQVMPLLPGHPGCAVIITSRSRLAGLPGMRVFELDLLATENAVVLLNSVIGNDRADADPVGTAQLAAMCGGMPLALRIAGAKLATRPHWTISRLVERLRDERQRLDELACGDLNLRASLSVTYQTLSPDARRLFRRLGLLDSPTFAAWTADVLVGYDQEAVSRIIDELVEAHLLGIETEQGGQRARYKFHELVRVFARDRLLAEETAETRDVVLTRVLGSYLALAEKAHRRMYGGDYTVLHGNSRRWHIASPDSLIEDPLVWFDEERMALLAAVSQAAPDHAELCWELAVTLVTYFEARGYFDYWRRTHEEALAAARRVGDRRGEAAVLCSLGSLGTAQPTEDDASFVSDALRIFTEFGDVLGQSLALRNFALICHRKGRLAEAAEAYERALAGFRSIRDEAAEAHVLCSLAQVYLDSDDLGQAESLARESLEIACRLPLPRLRMQALNRIGEVLLKKSQLSAAEDTLKAALAIAEQTTDRIGRLHTLISLGLVYFRQQRLGDAERCLTSAVALSRDVGDLFARGRALLALGEFNLSQGALEQAEHYLIQAASAFTGQNALLWRTRAIDVLALLYTKPR
jgi:DNA-binding SARP family transcriptional activator/tetratricopeptide (TPR) repeat protein